MHVRAPITYSRQRLIFPGDISNVPTAHVNTIVLLPAHAVSFQDFARPDTLSCSNCSGQVYLA